MPNELSVKSLFKHFPPATKGDWIKAAQKENDLTNNKTSQVSANELFFQPYYDREDSLNLAIKNNFELGISKENFFHGARSWLNIPPVSVNDVTSSNRKALLYLQQGADGILYECPETPDFKILLNSVQLEYCSTLILPADPSTAVALMQYWHDQNFDQGKIQGGFLWKKIPQDAHSVFKTYQQSENFLSLGVYIKNNSNPVIEIADALRAGVEIIEKLSESGADQNKIISKIFFSLESGNQFFFTVAKLKALRLLWYQVIKAYKAELNFDDTYLHVRCEALQSDAYIPQSNMLKSPLAALGAVSGGCQALSVYPEDSTNAVMERIALNVSNILREESHVNIVADPLAGSYYMDTLIDHFSRNAWKLFQNSLVN